MGAKRGALHGPPEPNWIALRCLEQIEAASHPVDIIAATLKLTDATRPTLPVGGGMLVGTHAHEFANDIAAALQMRGCHLKPRIRRPTGGCAGQLALFKRPEIASTVSAR